MSNDLFNKIINIVCIILSVIALAFAITACCLLKNENDEVLVENIVADENGNIVITYTDDSFKVVPTLKGEDGKSAYEIYVETVPEGETAMTKEEWLESLKGANGVGIENIYVNEENKLIIVLTDYSVYEFDLTKMPEIPDEETPETPNEGETPEEPENDETIETPETSEE